MHIAPNKLINKLQKDETKNVDKINWTALLFHLPYMNFNTGMQHIYSTFKRKYN